MSHTGLTGSDAGRVFVRTAGIRDLAAVRAVLGAACHAAYDAALGAGAVAALLDRRHGAEALRALLEAPNAEFLVADDGKTIAGAAIAVAAGAAVTLETIAVAPARQGGGIGGMLLEEIMASFFEAETIQLVLPAGNSRAAAFFEGAGFVRAAPAGGPIGEAPGDATSDARGDARSDATSDVTGRDPVAYRRALTVRD